MRKCSSINCIKKELFNTEDNPDIVLLDVFLGFADGRKVCSKIKEHLNIPVILMSSDSSVNSSAYKAGADYFIPKPLEINELAVALNEHL